MITLFFKKGVQNIFRFENNYYFFNNFFIIFNYKIYIYIYIYFIFFIIKIVKSTLRCQKYCDELIVHKTRDGNVII